MNAKPLIAATAIALLLAACGNKGPLVMPQKPVPVEEPAPAPAAQPADTTSPPPPATDPATPATVEPATPADGTHG
ncbi:MAG: lipoprotein [Pseudoxanthomonas sp.]|nr:lipoprotein [Pseudoxanthomonas sp.]